MGRQKDCCCVGTVRTRRPPAPFHIQKGFCEESNGIARDHTGTCWIEELNLQWRLIIRDKLSVLVVNQEAEYKVKGQSTAVSSHPHKKEERKSAFSSSHVYRLGSACMLSRGHK